MEVHYHDYLQLDRILNAQLPESRKQGPEAHDEMLFIVIHQAYELWFKQLHHEVDSILAIMARPSINDNSPELQTVVHRVNRCVTILRVLVHQIDIMETMTPMDFLDFRDQLRPASGFQSWQFKELEAKLGLPFAERHGKEYYTAQLRPEQVELIKTAESRDSLLTLVNEWLERMPLFDVPVEDADAPKEFWQEYRRCLADSLSPVEQQNLDAFDQTFADRGPIPRAGEPAPQAAGETAQPAREASSFSPRANRAALFILLYRGYPLLHLPFELLNGLLEIDEQLAAWRHRHMNMVHRMIGTRIGTGGSTGKDYLKGAADKHYIFKAIARLNSFLIERRKLPGLPAAMESRLGFRHC